MYAELANVRRRNALTWAMYDQLLALCDTVASDAGVRLVVIRGAGEAFAAGTDVRQFVNFVDGTDGTAYERRVAQVLDRLQRGFREILGDAFALGHGRIVARRGPSPRWRCAYRP